MTGVLVRESPPRVTHPYRYKVGDELAGEAQIQVERGARRAQIWAVEIAPHHRGQGHGRRLMQGLLRELELWGIRDVSLWVLPDNVRAIRLYASLGFRHVEENERGVLMRRTDEP